MAFSDEEIFESMEEDKELPSTCRKGGFGIRDDVAEGSDGRIVHVPTPETPDDPLRSS